MNSRKFALALMLALSFAFVTTAGAETVNFCFAWDQYFDDAQYGDYLIDNSQNVAARGVHFFVEKKISFNNWQTVVSDYTDAYGCKTLSLDYGERYRVLVLAHSLVQGNNIFQAFRPSIENPEDINLMLAQYVTSVLGFVLNANSMSFVYDYITPWKASNMMGASTYAFKYHSVNITDEYLTFLAEDVGGTSGGYNNDSQSIRLEEDARDRKFTITHEMGHFVHYKTNNDEDFQTQCNDFEDTICDCIVPGCIHEYNTKEYQGCAAKEGFAHFYAAAVCNDQNGAGCKYKSNDCDIYHTFMVDDCHPTPPFLYDVFDGYGVESDWLEFYWQLYAGTQKWSLTRITELFDYVYTSNWDGGGHENVIESLSEAAYALYGSYYSDYFDEQSDLGEGGNCNHACIGF